MLDLLGVLLFKFLEYIEAILIPWHASHRHTVSAKNPAGALDSQSLSIVKAKQ
ncbi:hypothetical protein M0D68_19010 [Paraburkholderia sp. SEWSISQ10-3 4]|uniref:hypothetical protein n=1 Tax=Paraburkholderia TaxID=1822464 RepID=UPI00190D89B5|nr:MULTISPECIES: hypothetical protein [Paraburkholderia]MBK3843150.1 hypothetical protein [Paraburkholderia aspalathi]MCX4140294.1 hypothetical protein [Paraburkholderia aspalathi]MDN7172981.1 hypothetical protein [Paraburkholderia sp. SEWSISQ10-3 4]MDQ6502620.1 hypothetical protein [Paraburkholderia aspalathi]